MTDRVDGSYVWTCPGCGRQVPHKVQSCRCGFQRTALPEPSGDGIDKAERRAAWGLFCSRTLSLEEARKAIQLLVDSGEWKGVCAGTTVRAPPLLHAAAG